MSSSDHLLNMEQEQHFFEKLPKESVGLVFITVGILLLVGAINRWKWVLDITGEKSNKPFSFLSIMHDWFGENGIRIGIIIISVLIIICGLALFFLMK